MALDKQMLLSELGSVMNKLQSADCGCMGKLFSNQGQYSNQGGQGSAPIGSQLPTWSGCRRGCCHGHGYGGHSNGYSAPCAGEPYNIHSFCNGMGPNIVNMMNGDSSISGKAGQQLTPAMATEAHQGQISGGIVHDQYTAEINNSATAYGGQQVQSQYMQQQNMSNATNPNTQNAVDGNMQTSRGHPGASYKINYSNPAAQQMPSNRGKPNYGQHTPGVTKFNEMFPGVMGGMGGDLGFDPMSIAIQMNPANQQQAAMDQMQKLMNGNPIERVLDPNATTNARTIQPAIAGANAAAAAINQPIGNQQNISPTPNQQPIPAQSGAIQQNLQQGYTNGPPDQANQAQQQVYGQIPQQQQQQVYSSLTRAPTMNQSQLPQQYQQQPLQQYQQQQSQQYHQQQNVDPNAQQYQQQQNVDPNAPNLPNMFDGTNADPDATLNQQPRQGYNAPPTSAPDQQMIKEPIFPVDTSKNQLPPHIKYQRHYEYNTLGQPVEMLPAKLYHQAPEANMQQTLSPQPITKMRNDQSRFVVKNTVSKTSIMGSRPVGRTPSRGQLQQIYNQYKGSHSYTQQNIRSPGQGATFSEGKINVALANANQRCHVPVERVGGDTVANSQIVNNQISVKGQPMGDIPVPADNKPHGDIIPTQEIPMKKTRNGLQDLVYTSYPTSAAWSFHGNNDRSHTAGYRLRKV